MSELEFLKAVSLVCGMYLNDGKTPTKGNWNLKRDCISRVTNCAVIGAGEYGNKKLIDKCATKYFNQTSTDDYE